MALPGRGIEWLWPLQSHHQASDPVAVSAWEHRGRLLLLALLLIGMPIAVNRAVTQGVSDFRGFYQASQFTLSHGARLPNTTFAYYLPSLDVAFAAIAWLPMPIAAVLWYLLGCWSWIGLLRSVNYYPLEGFDEPLRRMITLTGGLLLTPLAIDGLCLGSFQTFMVWWLVAGLGRIRHGRSWSGGVLLGLAVWIKLLPMLGVGYLILKRKWTPAVFAVAIALVLDIVFSVAGYGPKAAWAEHVAWWKEEAQGATQRQLTNPFPIGEDRFTNQSLVVICRRTLTTMGINQGGPRRSTTLLHLSRTQVQVVYLAAVGLLGLGVLAVCRRPGWQLSVPQWSTEIALVSLATLWFSPVIWGYHPTAATPALLVTLARVCRWPKLFWTVVVGWISALCLLGSPLACAFGEMFWTVLALGGLLVWTSRYPRIGITTPSGVDLPARPTDKGCAAAVAA
jgi:hypothetical protein